MYYVYTHMQYGIFLSVKNASALLPLRLALWRLCWVCVCVPCRLAIVPICTHTCMHWLWVSLTAAATCCCFSAFLLCFFYVSRYILCPSFSYFNCFCRFVSFISSATLHTFCISVPQNLTHCGKEEGERVRRGRARVSKRGKSVR